MTEAHREANVEWFGDTQAGEVMDLHPVLEDIACGRCRHPRWMHGGAHMNGPCHRLTWQNAARQCQCLNFIVDDGREQE